MLANGGACKKKKSSYIANVVGLTVVENKANAFERIVETSNAFQCFTNKGNLLENNKRQGDPRQFAGDVGALKKQEE